MKIKINYAITSFEYELFYSDNLLYAHFFSNVNLYNLSNLLNAFTYLINHHCVPFYTYLISNFFNGAAISNS